MVEGPVVRNTEKPGPQCRRLLQGGQFVVAARQGVLYHVLTIDDRAHHAGTVAMQVRTQRFDQGEKIPASLLEMTLLERGRRLIRADRCSGCVVSRAHAATDCTAGR